MVTVTQVGTRIFYSMQKILWLSLMGFKMLTHIKKDIFCCKAVDEDIKHGFLHAQLLKSVELCYAPTLDIINLETGQLCVGFH